MSANLNATPANGATEPGRLPPRCRVRVGSWFDGESFHPTSACIAVENGLIAAIETDPAAGIGAAWPLVDLSRFSALPTLIDSHVHCYFSPWPLDPARRGTPGALPFETEVANGLERVAEMQAAGLGAARDMGDPQLYNNAIRAALRERSSAFTLQSGGQGLFMPGRYGRFLGTACDPTDLAKEVDRLATVDKVDFIKLIPTGIINFNKGTVSAPPSYSVEEIKAVAARARVHGLKVAAHCSGAAGLDRCIAGGVDFIEHAYFATRDHLSRMRDAGLYWTPTVIPVHAQWNHAQLCGWDARTKDNLRRILDDHFARLRIAEEIGLPVLAGSDAGGAGVGHGGGVIEELLLFGAVYKPQRVLQIATANTHAALGLTSLGRLAVGARAQWVCYDRPPIEDLNELRHPRRLVIGGELHSAVPPRTQDHADALLFGLPIATPQEAAAAPAAGPKA